MNFNLGDWIVKVIELFATHTVLRRMYYAALIVVLIQVVRWW
ncbi:hypothetical protein [Bordetella avium]|nr:hypothetical protein [Bordetella avium]